jgi:aryl-alcohol dehydrogenase-like predicted oxidoreductase
MVGLGDRGRHLADWLCMGAPVSDSESIAALREALDCGVNFIDTELTPKWSGHTLRG